MRLRLLCIGVHHDFISFCQVVSASIVAPKSRYYPPKMYGFVTMKTEKEADLCIRELNLREVKGQKLLIEIVSRHYCKFYSFLSCTQCLGYRVHAESFQSFTAQEQVQKVHDL